MLGKKRDVGSYESASAPHCMEHEFKTSYSTFQFTVFFSFRYLGGDSPFGTVLSEQWQMCPRASGATILQKRFPRSRAAVANPVQTSCFPPLGLQHLLSSPLNVATALPLLSRSHPAAGFSDLFKPSALPPGPLGGMSVSLSPVRS